MAIAFPQPFMHPKTLPVGLVTEAAKDTIFRDKTSEDPHTPLPLDQDSYFQFSAAASNLKNVSYTISGGDEGAESRGDELNGGVWTSEEEEFIKLVMSRPARDFSVPFPPDALPPSAVIDEITDYIAIPGIAAHASVDGQTATHGDNQLQLWPHTWQETRIKVLQIALEQSRFGRDVKERKLPREIRNHRPGLRRMDSMDFLDQEKTEGVSEDHLGRALRLSSSLQSSAQDEKTNIMFQQPIAIESLRPQSHSVTSSEPLIPANPVSRAFRRCNSKSSRPSSLLQRGRSFTAADLQMEDENLEEDDRGTTFLTARGEQASSSTRAIGTHQYEKKINLIQPMTSITSQSTSETSSKPPARLIRSNSSYSVANAAPYSSQKMFLSTPQPSTAQSSIMPLSLQPSMKLSVSKSRRTNNGRDFNQPAFKKAKRRDGNEYQVKPGGIPIQHSLLQGGLQSPFEEKKGLDL
ncbi:hypothetical protein CNBH1270 [Cryptococcus deneoformans B-3501A]|uniref:Expressed protein n=1 Tax=Cryptococcus deneoformans (strain JEC21 / ATCC MYA-565) TaxID=214684 RepID=Q5KBU6_CRYD1|nr:expressed protein [Cryptococcus neoformans var. neoformans JEC21]XP_773672.1 hypothetical protein CNBH1270 [Cryptococcus neoformans var. neoformans B-3501A]AAW45477.1 expressed protein [Cryptococcus neoformans var. neoformans JEC21]EAL19025.1 hypothetical protein CNBH1270 [Cryptococcus neoformans var. neoformans B-3501A]